MKLFNCLTGSCSFFAPAPRNTYFYERISARCLSTGAVPAGRLPLRTTAREPLSFPPSPHFPGRRARCFGARLRGEGRALGGAFRRTKLVLIAVVMDLLGIVLSSQDSHKSESAIDEQIHSSGILRLAVMTVLRMIHLSAIIGMKESDNRFDNWVLIDLQ